MAKHDHLSILRGYRAKIKDYPEVNNFKSRRVEKLISAQDSNPHCKLKINFQISAFNFQINKYILNDRLNGYFKGEENPSEKLVNNISSEFQSDLMNNQSLRHSDLNLISILY